MDCATHKGILFRLAKGILLGNLSLGKARVCYWAILFKEMSDFGDSCRETQSVGDVGLENAHLAIFV